MPETKSLTIRTVEEQVAREFAAGAAIRGITQAEFLKRLLALRMEAALMFSLSSEIGFSQFEERFKALDLEDKYA